MSFNRSTAYQHAIAIATAALTSGSVKLEGPTTASSNSQRLNADAAYLNGLINSLAENLITKTKDQ